MSAKDDFDIEKVPLRTTPLPPFPLLAYPDTLPEADRHAGEEAPFDVIYVMAGKSLRKVEGQYAKRRIFFMNANMSKIAARRNYEAALQALGATKVSEVTPNDAALVAREGGDLKQIKTKMRLDSFRDEELNDYKNYLIRSAEGNTWIAVVIDDIEVQLIALQEKPMRQSVTVLAR